MSLNSNPNGFTRCKFDPEAKLNRPILPVFIGISGSISTILNPIQLQISISYFRTVLEVYFLLAEVFLSYYKVQQVLKSGRVNYWTGNECKEFEKEFSKYHKVKYSLSVSNGTVALEIALKALSLKTAIKMNNNSIPETTINKGIFLLFVLSLKGKIKVLLK